MKEKLEQQASVYARTNRRRKRWHQIVTAMAAVVVFCTTYALILPAITLENEPTCGLEEHQHEEACYQTPQEILVCNPGLHSHGPECLDGQGFVICQNSEYLVHSHDELCYSRTGELICELPEAAAHVHTEACYAIAETEPAEIPQTEPEQVQSAHVHDENCYTTAPGELICTEEEKEGHIHSDETGCYTYENELVCTAEENDGHTHGEGCFDGEGALICTAEEIPAHHHEETCYQLTAHLVCETEESLGHTHGENCYDQTRQVLICEETEEPTIPVQDAPQEQIQPQEPVLICGYGTCVVHQHTGDCFAADPEAEPILICETEEHVHDDLRCYADLEADVETEEDWVKTLPELSGYWREDILAIADSQVGYQESTRNYIINEYDEVKGYTRYGEWFGYPYSDWCAMFSSFCLHYAGITEDVVPYQYNCRQWIEQLSSEELNLYRPIIEPEGENPADAYTPVPGDLVFFDLDGNGISDHVGLVELLEENILHTIEGNRRSSVRRMEYELTDPVLMGYGMIPEQPAQLLPEDPTSPTEETLPAEETLPTEETEPEETEPEETQPEEPTEPTETPEGLMEQTIRAVIYTDASLQQIAEDETAILITGLLPEGAAARAYSVALEDGVIAGESVLLAYDITIVDGDGSPIDLGENQNTFLVSIQPPGWTPNEDEYYNIYYVPEDGEPEIMDSESREDAVSFTTDHFSTFVLTAARTSDTENTAAGFTVIKTWADDTETERPGSITVQLYRNGEAWGDSIELTAENEWSHTWTDLPEGFEYTAKEVEIPAGYYSIDDGGLNADGSWEIINTKIPATAVSAELNWPEDLPGADSVTVGLLAGGVKIDEAVLNADSGWFCKWSNLPKLNERGGEIIYTVEEAPIKGYSSTVAEGTATENTGDAHYVISHIKLPDSITFRIAKYAVGASENPTLLAGAQLELYRVTGDGNVTIPGTDQTGIQVGQWVSENASGTNGGIHVEDLSSGTYYLIETHTPSGHAGLSGPIVFEVRAEEETVNLIACPYELTLEPNPEVELPVYNSVVYVLPETGGMGTGLYTTGGWLLIIAAAVLLILSWLKRGRGAYPYS